MFDEIPTIGYLVLAEDGRWTEGCTERYTEGRMSNLYLSLRLWREIMIELI